MSRGVRGRDLLKILGRGGAGGGEEETTVSCKTVPEDLNVKFKSKFSHDFTSLVFCTVLFLKLYTVLG